MDLITHYSNTPDLLNDLRTTLRVVTESDEDDPSLSLGSGQQMPRAWSMADRLAVEGIRAVLDLYRAGATVQEVAERYAISESSVKRLLRQHDVRRSRRQRKPT